MKIGYAGPGQAVEEADVQYGCAGFPDFRSSAGAA